MLQGPMKSNPLLNHCSNTNGRKKKSSSHHDWDNKSCIEKKSEKYNKNALKNSSNFRKKTQTSMFKRQQEKYLFYKKSYD